MKKQDRQGARTPADLERKYNFGKTFAEVYGLMSDLRKFSEDIDEKYAGEIKRVETKVERTEQSILLAVEGEYVKNDEYITFKSSIEQMATENGAKIESITEWQDDTTTSLARIEQMATDNAAAIELLTKFEGDGTGSLAELVISVNANTASIESLTQWKGTTNETIAEIKQDVSANAASIKSLTEWKGTANNSIASVTQMATENKASIESIAEWQSTTNSSIASVTQMATQQGAAIESITEWQGDTNAAMAKVTQMATDNAAAIELLTKFEGDESGTLAKIVASVNANTASIESMTQWRGEVDTALTSVTQKADKNAASIESITEWQTGTNATLTQITQTASSESARIDSLVAWQGGAQSDIDALENGLTTTNATLAAVVQKADANGASITSIAEWQDVTTTKIDGLEDNIEVNTRNIASIDQRVDVNSASISLVVQSGEVQAGVIVDAINGAGSNVKISADHLLFEGETLDIRVDATHITGTISADQSAAVVFGCRGVENGGGLYCDAGHVTLAADNGLLIEATAGGVEVAAPLTVYGKLTADTAGLTTTVGNYARLDDLLAALLANANVAQTYIISYDAMGGYGAPSSQTKTHNVPLFISSTVPYKSGYSFKGWTNTRGSDSISYKPGDEYTANTGITLYAVWEPDGSGGGGGGGSVQACPECSYTGTQIRAYCATCESVKDMFKCSECGTTVCSGCKGTDTDVDLATTCTSCGNALSWDSYVRTDNCSSCGQAPILYCNECGNVCGVCGQPI